jgi:hypothetical protein
MVMMANFKQLHDLMETTIIHLTVVLAACGDGELPAQDDLMDKLTGYIYQFFIKERVVTQKVYLTEIDGEAVV